MEDISKEEELFGSYLISLNKANKLKSEIERIDKFGNLDPLPERIFKLLNIPGPNLIPELTGGNNLILPHVSTKLKLVNKENFSCGLVAQKKINQGDVLLVEKAAILPNHPQQQLRQGDYRCHHCLKTVQYFVTCPGCDVIFFCGYNCRYYSWNEYHRWECFGLQRGLFPTNDMHYVSMRMLFFRLQFEEGAISKDYYEKEYNIEQFKNLPYKMDEDKKKLFSLLKTCVEVVVYLLVHTSFFEWIIQFPKYKNKDQFKLYSMIGGSLLKFHYQFQQNSIQIKQVLYHGVPADNKVDFIIDGIFLSTPCFINDSHPNTDWFIIRNYLIIKAIKDISIGDKITVNWKTTTNDCSCKSCFNTAQLNAFKCFHCEQSVNPLEKIDCQFYFNLKYINGINEVEKNLPFICSNCKTITTLSEYKQIYEYSQHNIDIYISSLKTDYLDYAKQEYEKIIGKNHVFYTKLISLYFEHYLCEKSDVPKFIPIASELICLIETHYGKHSQTYLCSLLFILFRLVMYIKSQGEHKDATMTYCKSLLQDVKDMAPFYEMLGVIDLVIDPNLVNQTVTTEMEFYKPNNKSVDKKLVE